MNLWLEIHWSSDRDASQAQRSQFSTSHGCFEPEARSARHLSPREARDSSIKKQQFKSYSP